MPGSEARLEHSTLVFGEPDFTPSRDMVWCREAGLITCNPFGLKWSRLWGEPVPGSSLGRDLRQSYRDQPEVLRNASGPREPSVRGSPSALRTPRTSKIALQR